MTTLRIFIGVDSRAMLAHHVLSHSIIKRASVPVAITPLVLPTLPVQRGPRDLTEFTRSRFLVPWLCGYRDWALFLDSDILVRCDIADVFRFANPDVPMHVVKHEGRLRFERPSVILFNNALCTELTPERVSADGNLPALTFADDVGALPPEYNFLVGYDKPYETGEPKIFHYTQGNPMWPETAGCDYADLWKAEFKDLLTVVSWQALMGQSVHSQHVMERLDRERRQRAPAA